MNLDIASVFWSEVGPEVFRENKEEQELRRWPRWSPFNRGSGLHENEKCFVWGWEESPGERSCRHEDLWKSLEGLCASVMPVLGDRARQIPRGHWPDNIHN